MCGLVGIGGNITTKDVDVFKNMLYFDFLRGQDSTGIGSVSLSGEIRLAKAATDPLGLLSMKSAADITNASTRCLMGHNRHATKGKVNKWNAHPFTTGRILGAHNGTLEWSCWSDLSKNTEGDTDSEQIINSIHDADGRIEEVIPKMSGAWALTIYDAADGSISFIRNEKRPLFYCFNKKNDVIYWASEAWMLNVALSRNSVEHGAIKDLTPDTLLSWILPKTNQTFADKPARTKVEGKAESFFRGGMGYHGSSTPWMDWGPNSNSPDRRGSAGSNGGNTYAKRPFKPLDPEDKECWAEYAEGWEDQSKGRPIYANPFYAAADPVRYEQWRQGWCAAKDAADIKAKEKAADEAPKSDDADTKNVILLDDKRTKIYDKRRGPGSKDITQAEFEELTKNECGWCNNPVTFASKGFFMTHPSHGSLFICEDCKGDNNLFDVDDNGAQQQNA